LKNITYNNLESHLYVLKTNQFYKKDID